MREGPIGNLRSPWVGIGSLLLTIHCVATGPPELAGWLNRIIRNTSHRPRQAFSAKESCRGGQGSLRALESRQGGRVNEACPRTGAGATWRVCRAAHRSRGTGTRAARQSRAVAVDGRSFPISAAPASGRPGGRAGGGDDANQPRCPRGAQLRRAGLKTPASLRS